MFQSPTLVKVQILSLSKVAMVGAVLRIRTGASPLLPWLHRIVRSFCFCSFSRSLALITFTVEPELEQVHKAQPRCNLNSHPQIVPARTIPRPRLFEFKGPLVRVPCCVQAFGPRPRLECCVTTLPVRERLLLPHKENLEPNMHCPLHRFNTKSFWNMPFTAFCIAQAELLCTVAHVNP